TSVDGFMGRADDATVVAQHYYLQENPSPVGSKDNLDRAKDGSTYSRVHEKYHPWLHGFQQEFGYYDVFLIDPSGRVVYSVFKEVDFATSLANGPWAGSGLGKLYQQLRGAAQGSYAFEDYARYTPSYEAPASFIGSPIVQGGAVLGYVAFQMPIDRINQIMTASTGLGETGEIVLVGPDGLMRSDSRRFPDVLGVEASFRNPATGRIESPVVARAIDGETGRMIEGDRSGAELMLAFAPIDILGKRWCALGRIETAEVLAASAKVQQVAEASIHALLGWNAVLLLVIGGVMVGVGLLFSRRMMGPIRQTVAALEDIAEGEGDLTQRLDEERADELGEIGGAFNRFLIRIQDTIRDLGGKATSLTAASTQLISTAGRLSDTSTRTRQQSSTAASAAEQMSANMDSVSRSSSTMASTLRTIAAAVEEMTASIGEVAKSADSAATVANHAAELTRSSDKKVSSLGSAANEIGRVIETIQDIAEQTNLLALNATIEAARAGEAGKGFSVVANEVKDLARQTAEATQDIRQRIVRIQESTQDSIDAITEIDKVIAQVSAASKSIAVAVGEQRTTTQEIAQSLADNTSSVDVVNRNVAECVQASREISQSVLEVDQNASSTAQGANDTEHAGRQLSELALQLQSVVEAFKV
ncbi:MAG: methyl-accepting chemotaxis protein, partial [Planctomycetes bacterium]|nr:methyl-accepting chemotaxis protein [Planctomycetota bacterium]